MGEVVEFPKKNPRVEPGVLEQASVEDSIKMMKVGKFMVLADAIVDDVLRSIAVLKIEESVDDPQDISHREMIMLKEMIVSMMCKMVSIKHPLHDIQENELIIYEMIEDISGFDVPYFKYRFKSEPEEKSMSEF